MKKEEGQIPPSVKQNLIKIYYSQDKKYRQKLLKSAVRLIPCSATTKSSKKSGTGHFPQINPGVDKLITPLKP